MLDRKTLWLLLGVGALAALSAGGVMLTQTWLNSANGQKWAQFLADAEDYYGIPRGLLSRLAYQESRFRSDVIEGTFASPAGALGMMQLMPQYFTSVRRPVPFTDDDTKDQITEAAVNLVSLYHQFGAWVDAIAAYNAGPGAWRGVLARTHTIPGETFTYLTQVLADVPDAGAVPAFTPDGYLA